ncbi:MAG TPA: hypothetical protein VFM62_00330 [Arthrobacter sp.]|nr:hypothetical protein [Arthrobacter sp.]
MVRNFRTWKLGSTFASALMLSAVLTAGAAPASGAQTATQPTPGSQPDAGQEYCWLNGDSGTMQCFTSEAEMNTAMEQPTRETMQEPQLKAASPGPEPTPQLQMRSATADQQVVGRFYRDAGYEGGYVVISRSGGCSSGTHIADLSGYPGWNDTVSSFVAGSGCRIGLYDDSDLSGSFYGHYRSSSYVGYLNDRASSARFIAG